VARAAAERLELNDGRSISQESVAIRHIQPEALEFKTATSAD
jgi:hypothetical protein